MFNELMGCAVAHKDPLTGPMFEGMILDVFQRFTVGDCIDGDQVDINKLINQLWLMRLELVVTKIRNINLKHPLTTEPPAA